MRLTCFILFLFLSCSDKKPAGRLNNTASQQKTSDHVNIPGSRLSVIIPPGYQLAESFIGLRKGAAVAVNIFDLAEGNFYTNAASYSREGFERKGATVFHYEETEIGGYPAKYIVMEGEPGARVSSLVFGDSTFSVALMASYPDSNTTAEAEITEIINSIIYDKSLNIDPFANTAFLLNDSVSVFHFSQFSAGMYIYAIDGKRPEGDTDAPVVMVTTFPSDNMNAEEISQLFVEKSREYGAGEIRTVNVDTSKLNGYDAWQAELWGEANGNPVLIYQCIAVHVDKAVSIQGIARKDASRYLPEMKKLITTLHFKD